jgi:hypothetical protein
MTRSLKLLSILQIVVCLTLFITFFTTIRWLTAKPLEGLDNYPVMAKKHPPPSWAKSFSPYDPKPTYYPDYHAEHLGKKSIFISLFVSQWLFLVISAIYSYRVRKGISWKDAVKESLQEVEHK